MMEKAGTLGDWYKAISAGMNTEYERGRAVGWREAAAYVEPLYTTGKIIADRMRDEATKIENSP